MDKAKKQEIIDEIKELMDSSSALYLTDFTGMTVEEVDGLRTEFFKSKIKYKVVKNTLALRALKDSVRFSQFVEEFKDILVGPTGIVFAVEDPVAPA
ncbi:MAG: 50S ribosomal protein L10, partial [Ignavibacteriae bacterium]|nr:50S ribosomal protein L10 [Ignavibacteriota bacterium]